MVLTTRHWVLVGLVPSDSYLQESCTVQMALVLSSLKGSFLPVETLNQIQAKYPCGECGKAVKRNKDAILCAQCNIWSYAICLKLPKQSLNYYQLHPEIDWPCFLCSLPGLNDSFFSHNEQEVDSNFTADLLAAEKEQEDIRQLRVHYISFAGIEVRVGVVLRFIFKIILSPLPRNSVVIH